MNGNTAAALSVLREALLLETEGRRFYRRAAETMGDEKAATAPVAAPERAVFQFLAGEERGHLNLLMMRYEALSGPTGWTS